MAHTPESKPSAPASTGKEGVIMKTFKAVVEGGGNDAATAIGKNTLDVAEDLGTKLPPGVQGGGSAN